MKERKMKYLIKTRKSKKNVWTKHEENILFILQMIYGCKFSLIRNFIPNHSTNTIKNHFHARLRNYIRYRLKVLKDKGFFKKNNINENSCPVQKIIKIIKSNNICLKFFNEEKLIEIINQIEKDKIKKTTDNN